MSEEVKTKYFLIGTDGQIVDFDSKAFLNRHLATLTTTEGMTIIRGRVVEATPRLAV